MTTYGFQKLTDDNPILLGSPLVMGIAKTINFVHERGHIELTQSRAFKRSFVNWAAAEFNWPLYSQEELFELNKVLNESDFPPLAQIHALLMYLRLGKHFKGTFRLTKIGKDLVGRPGEIFARIAEPFILDGIHSHFISDPESVNTAWIIIANILNVEAETGVTLRRAAELFFPKTETTAAYDQCVSNAYSGILRPLCWLGLLTEHSTADLRKWDEIIFIKTPLWRTALRLETDEILKPITFH